MRSPISFALFYWEAIVVGITTFPYSLFNTAHHFRGRASSTRNSHRRTTIDIPSSASKSSGSRIAWRQRRRPIVVDSNCARLPARTQPLGQAVKRALRAPCSPTRETVPHPPSASSDHTTRLTRRQRRPMPLDHPHPKLHRHHRALAPAPIQRAPEPRPPSYRSGAVEHPMVSFHVPRVRRSGSKRIPVHTVVRVSGSLVQALAGTHGT